MGNFLIEIRKVKLTKSIVNQMTSNYSLNCLKNGEVLGYVVNCSKYYSKCFIIKYGENYHILPSGFKKVSEKTIYIANNSNQREFNTSEARDEWMKFYDQITEEAKQIYI